MKALFLLRIKSSIAILLVASLSLTAALLVLIQPNRLTQTAIVALILESNGLIFLYNWLPVVFIMLVLFFATGRLALSCGLSGLLFMLPAIANRLMIEMRHAPLRPLDLLLGMEFMGVAHSIQPTVFISLAAGLAAYLIVLALSVKLIKNEIISYKVRICGAMSSALIFILLFVFVYSDVQRYESLPMSGSQFNTTHTFQSRGFVYSFLHTMHHSRIQRPPYFSRFEAYIVEGATKKPENLPHIIMVLSEAFSDIGLSPYINFDDDTHLQHFLAIKEESLHGHIVVPHIGGGTADTEFDILTGINARQFRGVPYAFTMVTRPSFPNVASILSSAGYRSLAMHPGAGWFYNRQNVYLYLGFEKFLCDRSFDGTQLKGGYISEEHTIDRALEEFRRHLEEDSRPLFLKLITIQNHGPFYGKYENAEVNFSLTSELSDSDMMALANYFYGMQDVDEGLRRLVEYFRNEDEPVILLYYGDHLPSFPRAIYDALMPEPDSYEKLFLRNRLPFLIWANEAGLPMLNLAVLENGETISAHYLGAALLEMLGFSEPFFDFVNGLRALYPIVLEQSFFPPEGDMLVFDPNEHYNLALYNSWAYARIAR